MLVDLGHLLPRARVEDASVAGRCLPQLARGIPPRATLLSPGESAQYPFARRALEAALERRAIAGLSTLGIGRLPEAPEPGQLVRAEVDGGRLDDSLGHPARQRHEGEDVVAVVLEHARELSGGLAPQIVEVRLRDERAGQIVLAEEAEGVLLHGAEAAIGESCAPEPARRGQEIKVKDRVGPAATAQHETRLEERQVEARAVVCDDAVHVAQERIEGGQEGGLLVEVTHEVLPHFEGAVVEEAHPDEEHIGPGPARETRGLRVQVEQARARRRFAAREESERGLRDAPGPLEGLAPMMMIVGEAAADAQHVSSIRFLDRAPHQVLEGAASSKRRARPTLGLETANDLAEIGGEVAHGAWEMVSGDGRAV